MVTALPVSISSKPVSPCRSRRCLQHWEHCHCLCHQPHSQAMSLLGCCTPRWAASKQLTAAQQALYRQQETKVLTHCMLSI